MKRLSWLLHGLLGFMLHLLISAQFVQYAVESLGSRFEMP